MKKESLLNNWIVKNLLLAVLGFAVLIFAARIGLSAITRHNKSVPVPDFTNMSVAEAKALARAADLEIVVTDSVFIKRLDKGVVYRQNPKPGAGVKKGRHISLIINSVVPRTILMPNLVGYSLVEAKAEILNRGLNLGRLRYVDDMATNNVLKQLSMGREIKAGSKIISGSDIDLVLGLNPENNSTNVPNLTGLKYIHAIDVLHDNSLNCGKAVFDKDIRTYSDSVNAVVYKQEPAVSDEQVRMGTAVTLHLTLDGSKAGR